MSWLAIPAIFALITIAAGIVAKRALEKDWSATWPMAMQVGLVGATVISFLTCAIYYYTGLGNVREARAYYENIIEPNIVEESDDCVTVSSVNAAVWQAGDYNVSTYNGWLARSRYWNSIPLIGTTVYDPPADLKYVRVK